ncbi:rod shape-determining protein MreC [bacterium]|nr:rod shape-determining protein MreC [bacterium]
MHDLLQYSKPIFIFLFFMVLSLCLLTFQLRVLDNAILMLFTPIQKVLISVFDDLKDVLQRGSMLLYIRDEYERITKENIALKTKINELTEAQKQVVRLEEILNLQQNLPYQTIAAKVIGKSPITPQGTLIIDKGSNHGIRKYQGVINSAGVVGRIIETLNYSAKVQVITDQNCSIAALDQKSRDNGLVRGYSYINPLLKMDFVYQRAQIATGDLIITSGLDQVFPKGLLIGTVKNIDIEKGDLFYKTIEIEPAVDLSRIEEVLVVVQIEQSVSEN